MQVCANCGHNNRPGVVFCENCGTSLLGRAAAGVTKSFDDSSTAATEAAIASSAGTDHFARFAALRIEVEGAPEPIVIRPKDEIVFGRRDPATGAMPDIDLTPFAGYRMGVSRRHAAIRAGEENHLDIWDLGSSNGTFLNGVRLTAHRPYRLRDGDRLRLGQMVIRVLFAQAENGEPAEELPQPPASAPQVGVSMSLLDVRQVETRSVTSLEEALADEPAEPEAEADAEPPAAAEAESAPAAQAEEREDHAVAVDAVEAPGAEADAEPPAPDDGQLEEAPEQADEPEPDADHANEAAEPEDKTE